MLDVGSSLRAQYLVTEETHRFGVDGRLTVICTVDPILVRKQSQPSSPEERSTFPLTMYMRTSVNMLMHVW